MLLKKFSTYLSMLLVGKEFFYSYVFTKICQSIFKKNETIFI